MDRVVLVVSVPASELEMTPSDQEDYDRIKKLLDRVGKPVQISHEKETAEIIRRRLFEWDGVPPEANKIIQEYADWVVEHRQQVPSWFPVDRAREEFKASYPFHPLVISVFETEMAGTPPVPADTRGSAPARLSGSRQHTAMDTKANTRTHSSGSVLHRSMNRSSGLPSLNSLGNHGLRQQ